MWAVQTDGGSFHGSVLFSHPEHSQDGTTGRPRGRRGFRGDPDPTAGATAAGQIKPSQQLREETPRLRQQHQHHRDSTGQNCRRRCCSEHHAGSRNQCFHPAFRYEPIQVFIVYLYCFESLPHIVFGFWHGRALLHQLTDHPKKFNTLLCVDITCFIITTRTAEQHMTFWECLWCLRLWKKQFVNLTWVL